jgi:Sec-independent protein translocase protein TatA
VNIFGIGGAEIILIFLIMIVVAGPKRMAQWAYLLGTYVGKIRQMWAQVAAQIEQEMKAAGVDVDVPRELPNRQNMTAMVVKAGRPLAEPIEQAGRELERDLKAAESDLREAEAATKNSANQALKLSNTLKTPATAAAQPVAPAAPPANDGFGTWGAATPTEKPLGSWSDGNQ